jgi:hypothetical protein
MRNVWSTASIIVLGLSVAGVQRAAAQANGFEGVTTYQMHSENGKTMTMVATSKGNKLRLDVNNPANPAQGGSFVMDGDAHTRTLMMAQQKKYIVIPESMAGAMGGMGKGADAADAKKLTFTKTGRTETVAGVTCQVIHGTGTDSNGKTEEGDMCVAKGVGFNPTAWQSLAGQAGAGNSGMAAVSDAVGPGNGILKMTTTKAGGSGFSMEVTNINKSSVPDDAFSPPAGYTQMQMPAGAGAPR